MTNTAEQSRWAEQIRTRLIETAKQTIEDAKANPNSTPDIIAAAETNLEVMIDGLSRIDDAFIVDNRDDDNAIVFKAMELGQITNAETAETAETDEADETAEADDEAEAANVEQVYVMVPKERIFKTRYGWGLILDRDHVQWLSKDRVWCPTNDGAEVTLYRDEWKPKMAKRPYDGYDADDNETKWSTWVKRADEYKGYGN